MAPNVYATVSLLQNIRKPLMICHRQRMYGSVPIFVEDKNTVLNPVLNIQIPFVLNKTYHLL